MAREQAKNERCRCIDAAEVLMMQWNIQTKSHKERSKKIALLVESPTLLIFKLIADEVGYGWDNARGLIRQLILAAGSINVLGHQQNKQQRDDRDDFQ